MKIKQFRAPTMQEAIARIKVELGSDAVILHQKTVRVGGFLGFWARHEVEVLAAVDETSRPSPVAPPSGAPLEKPVGGVQVDLEAVRPWDPEVAEQSPKVVDEVPARSEGRTLAVPPLESRREPASAEEGRTVPSDVAAEGIVAEVKQAVLREIRGQVRDSLAEAVGDVTQRVEDVVLRLEQMGQARSTWSPAQQRFHDRMVKQDVEPALVRQMLARLHALGATHEPALTERFPEVLDELVRFGGPILPPPPDHDGPRLVALVGPTGVGKTTTIAKLAATWLLQHKASVGLITFDTYRVAAVDQLKVYGDIIGVPVEVVLTPGGLREALKRLESRDLVLIDTPGRSPSHKLHLSELRSFLDVAPGREVHLVLAAPTTRINLVQAVESFSQVGVDRLLFTKMDEALTQGALISVANGVGLPLSYVTVGQAVPDDLVVAGRDLLLKGLLG
ncbi:MAG: flagellar biosynthesis protein FlhF [Candidatus Sericytochromatia bacterium]|nr:flagellar biosynthesis protein FlhF [Candidatus Sericytochromatia bacterium]